MDYEKLKALMEANREEPTVQRNSKIQEFPKPDAHDDCSDQVYIAEDRIAA
jgi:hypothetical protein